MDLVRWGTPGERSSTLLAEAGFAHAFDGVGSEAGTGGIPDIPRLRQVHGTTIVARVGLMPGVEADGMWSETRGLAVAVRTADCLPILLADRDRRLVLAVHAGWRGVVAGMLPRAVATAEERGVPAEALIVAIGPSIQREAFEVGPEVADQFWRKSPLGCAKGRGDRWHIDLTLVAVEQAIAAGVPPRSIEASRVCTMGDGRWHSYRRDQAQGRELGGSNWSWISL